MCIRNIRMDQLKSRYDSARTTISDIFIHLPVLKAFASCCTSVLELGTRECVSSWGVLMGLVANPYAPSYEKSHIANDLAYHPNVEEIQRIAKTLGVNYKFIEKNDLFLDSNDIPLPHIDMVFIDTWHVYGQLRRELEKFAPFTKKYIVMHDTEVDGIRGESIRLNQDVDAQAAMSGFTADEVCTGLIQAIDEFIVANKDWFILMSIPECNGLTILARRGPTIYPLLL